MAKKSLLFVCCSVIFVLFFASCDEQVSAELTVQEEITAVDNLKTELLTLNNDYVTLNPQTRSVWKTVVIVAADVAGTLVGGLKTGITASKLAKKLLGDQIVYQDPTITIDGSLVLEVGSAGFVHNAVLIDLFNQYGDEINNIPTSEMVDIVDEVSAVYIGDDPIDNKEEVVALLDQMMLSIDMNLSVTEYMDIMQSLTTDESTIQAIEVSTIVIEGLQQVMVEDTSYIISVMDIVNNSNIEDLLKEKIIDGVSVAYASSILWDDVQP